MTFEVWNWLLTTASSTGLIGLGAYLMRDTIGGLFTNAVEHRFEKRLETFKTGLRDNEKELDQIRSFMVAARRDRDTAIQSKRLEAAETLLRARHSLSQLSMLVEYMKILNTERILRDGDDPKITEFIDTLTKPFDIDTKIKQLGEIDKTLSKLYLDDRTLKAFDAYEGIVLQATMMMKLLSLPLADKKGLVKEGHISKKITDLAPAAKEGFERWGEEYAYHWADYFYNEILRSLRHEVSGADDTARDAESVERLALDSRRAQINIRSSLDQSGLSDSLLHPTEGRDAAEPVANKRMPE